MTILLTFLSKGTRQAEYWVALLVTFHSFWGFSQVTFQNDYLFTLLLPNLPRLSLEVLLSYLIISFHNYAGFSMLRVEGRDGHARRWDRSLAVSCWVDGSFSCLTCPQRELPAKAYARGWERLEQRVGPEKMSRPVGESPKEWRLSAGIAEFKFFPLFLWGRFIFYFKI